MNTVIRLLGVLVLIFGLGLIAAAQPAPKKMNPTVAAVLKLADNLDRSDVPVQAKKIFLEYDACDMSLVFTHRGAGIGSAVRAGHKDSIDDLVRNWSGAKPPAKEELRAYHHDLLKVARVIQAMAEIAPLRRPIYVPKEKSPQAEEWQRTSVEFKAVAREFHDAIAGLDPDRTRKAVVSLHKTCMSCHKVAGI